MTAVALKNLAGKALELPKKQRLRLAQTLWDSVDGDADLFPVDPKVLETVRRRKRELAEGKVRGIPFREAMKAARAALRCAK